MGHGVVTVDPSKLTGITEWPQTLSTVKEICSTLGVLGFQRPFIPGFADIARPLTNLLKKDTNFEWTNECTTALDKLIKIVMTSPVLAAPDPD